MDSEDLISIIIAVAKDAVEGRELELLKEKNNDFERAVVDCKRKKGAERELEKARLRCDLDYIRHFNRKLEMRGILIPALEERISHIEYEIKMISLEKKINSRIP